MLWFYNGFNGVLWDFLDLFSKLLGLHDGVCFGTFSNKLCEILGIGVFIFSSCDDNQTALTVRLLVLD